MRGGFCSADRKGKDLVFLGVAWIWAVHTGSRYMCLWGLRGEG